MNKSPIGVFDSGLGGLTVLKEIMRMLPNENIIYFGDTARVPYGPRSKETVTKYTFQAINFLISKGVKAIVIACNTATARALEEANEKYDIPANISEENMENIRRMAVEAFKGIDGKGLSRVDFFIDRNSGEIFINEINTLPGFTNISMYPKMWEATGLEYTNLIDRLIELAIDSKK